MEQQNKTKRIPWNKGQKGVISSPRKGLTLIEEYGEERAKEIRDKIKKARAKQVFSEEAKEKHRLAIRKSKLGKTYEEMYGVEKTNEIKQNAVSLCNKNHAETNVNRTSWKIFFQSLLKERYGYEYTEDQKIILDFTEGA